MKTTGMEITKEQTMKQILAGVENQASCSVQA